MRYIYPARLPDPRDFPKPVHDGDTLWLTLDRGHRIRSDEDVRLKNTWAPELSKPGGVETHSAVLGWLRAFAPLEDRWPLSVETFATRTGNPVQTLARYVGVVYAGNPEDVRAYAPALPCLNTYITKWLEENGDPAWGGGTGAA